MRLYSPETLDALERGDIREAGAVFVDADSGFRAWTGFGQIEIEGETFHGAGSRGSIRVDAGALGGAEQGAQLSLSGVEPDKLELFRLQSARNAPAVIWELLFDRSGRVLLDARPALRGRVDELILEDVIGGLSMIRAMIEGAARALGKASGRMRTDADQRLIQSTDGGFAGVSWAGEVMLGWAGKMPARIAGVTITGPISRWTRGVFG